MKTLIGLPNADQMDLLYEKVRNGSTVMVQSYEQFLLKMNDSYDRIAVHCDLFPSTYPWDWMYEIKQLHPNAEVRIALSTKTYDSIYNDIICRIAEDFEFTIIPQGLTELQVADKFLEESESGLGLGDLDSMSLLQEGTIISIMSASSKDGATTIAVNTAIALAKRTDLRIGLLDLNLKNPDLKDNLNIVTGGKSLLSLRPKCSSNTLNSREIMDHCFSFKGLTNLHMLMGTNRRDTASDVTMEQVKNLLDAAKRTFDVVIVDVHTFPDNAATVYAVKHASERWIVAQPSYASFKLSWADWYDCYWRHCGLNSNDFSLIVNRSDSFYGIKVSSIEAESGMKLLAVLPNVGGGLGLRAVNEGVPFLFQESCSTFAEAINELIFSSAVRLRLPIEKAQEEQERRKVPIWFSRIMSAIYS